MTEINKNTKRILLVEDDGIIVTRLTKILYRFGYKNVEAIAFGENVIDNVRKGPPDLIIVDIRLSGKMDGIEVAEQLNTQFDIPLIFVTAYSDEELLKSSRLTQTYAYLIKPINERELYSTIELTLYRHKMESKLRRSEYKFRLFADNTYDWEYWVDQDGKYVFISDSCEDISGYCAADFYENHELLYKLVHPDYKELVKTHFNNTQEKETPKSHMEFPIFNRNGELRWIEHNCIPIFDEQGSFMGRRGNNRDITESKHAEEKLKNAHKQLEELYRHQDEIKENERKTISREIHDELGQLLTALKIDLGWTKDNIENKADVEKKISGMIDIVNDTIKTVQRISSKLRPGLLDDLGLVPAIEWYVQEFEQRTNIKTLLELEDIDFPDQRKNLALYRIVQEAFTNIIRHANAKKVNVNFYRKEDKVILEIIDDGIGMKPEKKSSSESLGLIGIQERIKQFNGSFDISSELDKGTKISVVIPFE